MANGNYSVLKDNIDDYIKQNGDGDITGQVLQTQLFAMITSLGAGYQFMGVAKLTPTPTDPGSPDQNVFYVAFQPGIYSNFGNQTVADGEIAILKWNGSWTKEVTGAASAAKLDELGQKVDGLALGKFYGFFPATADLPAGDDAGYAYVGASAPFAIYVFDGSSWSDSGSVYSYPVGNGEDIDINGAGQLQFANRTSGDGMGYVILRTDNTFAAQVTDTDTIYEIRYEFDLGGDSVTIPAGCVLKFVGGKISNGTLVGNYTRIVSSLCRIFGDSLTLSGTWAVGEAFIQWFGAKCDGVTNDASAFSLTLQFFKRIHITNKVRVESSITFNNHTIINDGEICNTTPITMSNNSILEGGKVICESPYYAINVTGENNVVMGVSFIKSQAYPVLNVDVFICISHTAIGTKVEGCVFGDNALYDILVAGLKSSVSGCRFLAHVDDTSAGKACAIKCSLDRTQDDADETATGASDLVIERCIFEFHTDNAIDTFIVGKNVVIRDNVFEASKEGSIEFKVAYRNIHDQGTCFPSGRYSEGIVVANNHFKGYITIQTTLLDGVYETIPKYMEFIRICGNRFDVNDHYAIILNSAMNITIDGNLFKGSLTTSEYGCIALQGETDNTIVSNNRVHLEGAASIFYDVRPSNSEKCSIIRGNTIKVETGAGVFRYSGQYLKVEDNKFEDCLSVVYPQRGNIEHLLFERNIVKNSRFVIANVPGTTQVNDILMNGNVLIDCVSALKNDANLFPFVSMSDNMVVNDQDNSLGTYRLYYLPTGQYAINGDYFHQGRNFLKLKDSAPEEYVRTFGTTSQRPTTARKFIQNGFTYYDKTLGKMILWNGTTWVNMDGTALS